MITNRSGNKTYVLLLIVFLIGFASHTDAQFYKRKINRYKNQLRDGLWITYVDSTNKTIESKGRFKKGFEKGTWKYYSADGILKKKDFFKKINFLSPIILTVEKRKVTVQLSLTGKKNS